MSNYGGPTDSYHNQTDYGDDSPNPDNSSNSTEYPYKPIKVDLSFVNLIFGSAIFGFIEGIIIGFLVACGLEIFLKLDLNKVALWAPLLVYFGPSAIIITIGFITGKMSFP